jgi:hypothetical protein
VWGGKADLGRRPLGTKPFLVRDTKAIHGDLAFLEGSRRRSSQVWRDEVGPWPRAPSLRSLTLRSHLNASSSRK